MSQPMPELWVAVPGYTGFYEVSTHGAVRSLRRMTATGMRGGRIMKQALRKDGYRVVSFSKNGVQRVHLVHALVAAAFFGPRPKGAEVRHLDGNRQGNTVTNLAYGSKADNMQDALRHGTNAKRALTRCPSDHPYDEENTKWYRGYRICLICVRQQGREYWERQKTGIPAAPRGPYRNKGPRPAPAVRRTPILSRPGEVWRPVPEFDYYEASSYGRIRSVPHMTRSGVRGGLVLKPGNAGQMGYEFVGLSGPAGTKNRYVHYLVASTFRGQCPNGRMVRHLDGDHLNNAAWNLVYGTYSENGRDTVRHGRNRNASRVTCDQGHPFDEANTIVRYWPDGTFKQRVCRICCAEWRATSRELARERNAS